MKSSASLSQQLKNQINDFLVSFSKEGEEVRNELCRILPSYNRLLSLNVRSFEELALHRLATSQGYATKGPRFNVFSIRPPCPSCHKNDKVYRLQENRYRCRTCNKKFTATDNSIVSSTNCDSLVWMQVLHCMLEFYSAKRACKECGITMTTFYNIRNKLFYAMRLLMDEVKLYGVIRCDNTYVHTNFKGSRLENDDYPEDSVFNVINFIPRRARSRGGPYKIDTKTENIICLYTAIDDFGHVAVKYVGIGYATATKLLRACPPEKYILTPPKDDPFTHTPQHPAKEISADKTLLVSDSEPAILKYAEKIGIESEHHVYRRNGVQVRLPAGARDIQRINALHKRLKEFFRRTNHVSSKYLPGFLTFFEFLENTGATDSAIQRLFEILVTPGLGRDANFYAAQFETPNYIVEWSDGDQSLKKFSYNYLLAAYLYHEKLHHPSNDPDYTMERIMEETGYSTPSAIRRTYKNIVASGLMDVVLEKFNTTIKIVESSSKQLKPRGSLVPEIYLVYYDAFCEMLQRPSDQRVTTKKYLSELNNRYHNTIKPATMYFYFDRIESARLRKLSYKDLKSQSFKKRTPSTIDLSVTKPLYECYLKHVRENQRNNIKPTQQELYLTVAEEFGIQSQHARRMILDHINYMKSKKE